MFGYPFSVVWNYSIYKDKNNPCHLQQPLRQIGGKKSLIQILRHFHGLENLSGIFWGEALVLAFSADFG